MRFYGTIRRTREADGDLAREIFELEINRMDDAALAEALKAPWWPA